MCDHALIIELYNVLGLEKYFMCFIFYINYKPILYKDYFTLIIYNCLTQNCHLTSFNFDLNESTFSKLSDY